MHVCISKDRTVCYSFKTYILHNDIALRHNMAGEQMKFMFVPVHFHKESYSGTMK